jgi:hypothetical protein
MGAAHVVAAAGSASLMAIFGRPGMRVGVLMPPYPRQVGWLTQASRALDIRLTALLGTVVSTHTYAHMSDYEVDPALLVAYLDEAEVDATDRSGDWTSGPVRDQSPL